jgi:cellobiose phosphorylase
VISEWVLGVRPTWEGLRFDPCLPAGWTRAAMRRPWRGATLHIEIERVAGMEPGEVEVTVDAQPLAGGVLGEVRAGAVVRVGVRCRC